MLSSREGITGKTTGGTREGCGISDGKQIKITTMMKTSRLTRLAEGTHAQMHSKNSSTQQFSGSRYLHRARRVAALAVADRRRQWAALPPRTRPRK
eukprot:m.232820 g.232820  ORF g.232820 m.232820 type:complete len:96 (+) comp54282_c1_seq7:625-912(+)